MIVLYFASLKEALNTACDTIDITCDISVSELKIQLNNKYDMAIFNDSIICAINHSVAKNSSIITNNDEVAFYPQVTGG